MPACDGCFSFSAAFRKGSPLAHLPPSTSGNFATVSAGTRLDKCTYVMTYGRITWPDQVKHCSHSTVAGSQGVVWAWYGQHGLSKTAFGTDAAAS